MTPGIPIRMADRAAGVAETFFQAMASTLIYGKKDAVLVDTFMTTKQANDLADWVESKGKNLTTIYITGTETIGSERVLSATGFLTPDS